MVWSISHYVVYKYNQTVRIVVYKEDESKGGAIYSIILLYLAIMSTALYLYLYWFIMEGKELQEEFAKLHKSLIDMVCAFAKKNGLSNVSACSMSADGMEDSVNEGKWHASTDSDLVLLDNNNNIILESLWN